MSLVLLLHVMTGIEHNGAELNRPPARLTSPALSRDAEVDGSMIGGRASF
jgi:hypothetical protein